nr:DegV family EDD domain-containing protein [Lachnospiraceae bacterium]
AIRIIVALLVFIILPAVFFFGGGVEGGGVLWFIFAFLYIGLVISGIWRNVLLIAIVLLAGVCYYIDYNYPELIYRHSRAMFYKDSFISLILVGGVCFAMVNFQNRLFREENERAKKEKEKTEELNIAQNHFFSSMSHEIRTPINSILGLNELILRDPKNSGEVVKEAFGIQGAGKMLLTLINDILDFSKVKAGRMEIVPVDYNVGNMISEIVNMLWLRAQDKGLKFNISIDPKVPAVLYGDEVRIKQILINLLNNAVKYTSEGSVGLHIESKYTDENMVSLVIDVSDTGMGIKKDAIPLLFDVFKRVDEDKNRHIEGTGLGLAIVKQLVDLMEGSISVDSVYGEGSTFTVKLIQGVSDNTGVGELNIQNYGVTNSGTYESSFTAPAARILIVDDNEMNLEVERKLLADTRMQIDTVKSGRDALNHTIKHRYDVILMDHLMPEMDGIICMHKLREQVGGLNQTAPVIVLTANAGSDNRELYQKEGFDGYLVKPVSGNELENMLIRHIPKSKLNIRRQVLRMGEGIKTAAGYVRKIPVIISSGSLSDLPESVVRKLGIAIMPHLIKTDEGIFKDGSQIVANELVRYIRNGGNAISVINDVPVYTDFFAQALKHAHNLIHISFSLSMSQDYNRAMEAAEAFDNVSVIASGSMSSGAGILVLIASRLARQGIPADEIVRELENVKQRLQCSFVLEGTEYLTRNKLISRQLHNLVTALQLHPCLKVKNDKTGIGGFWPGDMRYAYRKYIRKAFPAEVIPDTDIVFITYVDVPEETLLWFRDEVLKLVPFKRVVFKQASAAISSNCGPGTIGVLYYTKGEKSYNISSFFDVEEEYAGEDPNYVKEEQDNGKSGNKENCWYDDIEGIDGRLAIQNSGSEEAFRVVLEIFYKAIDMKAEELEDLFDNKDWNNYTIKVHALKSSSKLIGASELADETEALELAGKEGNIGFIRENHRQMITHLIKYKESISKIFEEPDNGDTEEFDEEFDGFIMESLYESLKEALDGKDTVMIKDIFAEMEKYPLPEQHRKTIEQLKECFEQEDFDGMISIIEGDQNE